MSAEFSLFGICCLAAAVTAASCAPASAQIITTPNIKELCTSSPTVTHRKTIVYVDVSAIQKTNNEWGLTILNRLALAPREVLTVVAVDPQTFEIAEAFNLCYPKLTDTEISEDRKARGIWNKLVTSDPADQQRENLQTFDARLKNSLNKIVAESKKYKEGDRRNILGAIAFDKDRFSDPTAAYRMIVYTDGTIKDSKSQAALGERYPANFAGADVFVFGVNGNVEDQEMQQKQRTFAAFFQKNWGRLSSFSAPLPQQTSNLYSPTTRMDGTYEGGGAQGAVKLVLFTVKQGAAAYGWLAFTVRGEAVYVPFSGDFNCKVNECRLAASSTQNVPLESQNPYFRIGDQIVLGGKNGQSLDGSLQAAGREVFKDIKQNVSYALKFSGQ
jgi:hypothetical protein